MKDILLQNFQFYQEAQGSTKRKIFYTLKNEALESTVYAWLQQKLTLGELVPGILLKEKAKFMYEKLKEQGIISSDHPHFTASSG